ncbi:MAG TPA: BlaI/MecI/CopY family transcriptional regulator [Clostridia bacterium]|jgi:BlaI family penicillinase repressor|nr:MAG: Transcriptional regulator BlaI [Firmicutes bacterium ADurb.Bin248]HOF99601.1 BlaI/MecI/CopY family transcriptional regulator [Clostridia bacterium]HOS18281.1 BlaI/MecI/CopY family transcriptional regulator [Clostridia bacterium]HPK14525.1 BlaI/MecI/CopY family transcriptional regulator [Clostridia bacterium]
MSKQKNALTTPEWIVMDALWDREPQVLGEIIESIGARVDWSYTTYASYMKILADKGLVAFRTRGRMKFYYPAVSREECIESEGESILRKLGGNDAEKLMLCMMKKTGLSPEGQARVREIIDALCEKDGERA